MNFDLWNGDCLDLMDRIPDKSVDMILCDLPYGTTSCKWDACIDLDRLWAQYERVAKDNAAICLFSQMPFTAHLTLSNLKLFRYEWVWIKGNRATGFMNAKKMPLKCHENILVFYKNLPTYNPQMRTHDWDGNPYKGRIRNKKAHYSELYDKHMPARFNVTTTERYPIDAIKFGTSNEEFLIKHPTLKPVDVCKYLIETYTNKGEVVLDNCMGSGSTGVACAKTGRSFIGIEMDPKYFDIAKERINSHLANKEVCV